jgi:O-antigen ligase
MDRPQAKANAAANPVMPRVRLELLPSMILLCSLPFAHTIALRLICLFVGLLLAAPTLRREWRLLPCALAIVVWAGICLASVAWSVRPAYSFGEFRNEVFYPVVAFATFYAMARGEGALRAWALSLAAGFFVAAAFAVYYYFRLPLAWQKADFLLGDVNQLSTYLVLIAPIFAAFALQRRATASGLRALLIAAGALFIAAGWFTQNRTLWLALLAQTIVFAALYLWREERKVSVRDLATVVVICAAILGLFALTSYNKSGVIPLDAAGWETDLDQSMRPKIWRYGLEMWAQRPLLGYGYGRGILGDEFTRSFGTMVLHAHNMFLDYALETGAVGLCILAVLFASLAWKFVGFVRANERETRIIGIAGLCLVIGAIAKSTTDDPLVRENSLLFWALLGMLLGRVPRQVRPPR